MALSLTLFAAFPFLFLNVYCAAASTVVTIPSHYTYKLPSGFRSTFNGAFVGTTNLDQPIAGLLSNASNAPFIAYDEEFLSLLGPDPQPKSLAGLSGSNLAVEGGIYSKDTNSVWFTDPGGIRGATALNLTDNTLYVPEYDDTIIISPVGGTYSSGKIYLAYLGNETSAPGVAAVDPITGTTETITNNYFGLRFNGPNDITWAQRGSRRVMLFTDTNFSYILNITGPNVLPNSVWAVYFFDDENPILRPVIDRAEILYPNGVAVNKESTRLYVTNTPVSYLEGTGVGTILESTDSPAIYVFDLTEDLVPVNKRLFGFSRSRAPDGMKVDRRGRVWTAEGEGITIRNEWGKVIGLFNSKVLVDSKEGHISNFALAGDEVVILAENRIWSVKLAEVVEQ